MRPISGRATLAALALAALTALAAAPAWAQVEVDITQGQIQPIPVAIAPFLGDGTLPADITEIVSDDLEGSGFFKPVNQSAFLERVASIDAFPRFENWRPLNAQALVVGWVSDDGNGKIQAKFRLWDVFSGKQLAGEQFTMVSDSWRRVGHMIADTIYERLTGEKGYFDSRIIFVDESGPKDKRVKRLAMMDQDGKNLRVLSKGTSLVLTPRFSPNNQEITFTSYEQGTPRVIRLSLSNNRQEVVSDIAGMTFAPRFSPDGQRIVMSVQQGGNSNIYEMDLRTRQTVRLTATNALDTAPCYSPDGRQITFESDRDGAQAIFVMNADGTSQRRISGSDGSYSTPVWSPRGDLIAFTKRTAGSFLIGVIRPDGTGERILTEGFHNEGPTWSPNGRVIMFFREAPGSDGGAHLYTIDLTGYNERRITTPAFASDPAWSPLLN
jgi:TolB protein